MHNTISCEVIKSGQVMFSKYLNDTVAKKNEKKRKSKDDKIDKKPDYSPINLIKIHRQKLSSNQLLAQQLIKSNFISETEQDQTQQQHKYYEDFEAAQKLNDKIIKRLTKPLKRNVLQTLADKRSSSPFRMFRTQSENLLQIQTQIQLDKIDTKNRVNTKLQTTKQILEQIDQKMLFLSSDLQVLFRQREYMQKVDAFNSEQIKNLCSQFKDIFAPDNITNTTYNLEKQYERYSSLVQDQLPSYLRRSQYQTYIPLPWKTNQLEKQLARTSFQQITGKVLYKYEHNISELKENHFKMKIHEIGKGGFSGIQNFLKENSNSNNLVKKEDTEIKESKLWKDLIPNKIDFLYRNSQVEEREQQQRKSYQDESKGKQYFSRNLVSGNVELNKKNETLKQPQFHEPIDPNLNRKSQKNRPNNYNSDQFQNFIKIRSKVPQNSLMTHNPQQLNLDQYTFSKHDSFMQNQNFLHQNDKNIIKQKETPRNIIFHDNIQSPPRRKAIDTRYSKARIPVQIYTNQSQEYSENQSSSSEESKFFNTMTQYKQKNTTKKKKSFLKKTPPRSSSHGEIKIKQSRNVVLSKKGQILNFYPLRIGNLILQKKNYAYLEYNSAKQELKNLTVKFLIDRIKHGVNQVQIVVPSFGFQAQNTMKVNDQIKAKQIIKIILSLGGNVDKIKPRSGYEQKTSGHEKTNRPKISTQIQIYKFFYKDLSYYEIIDALNLQKQWLESERDDRKLGGWKY